MGILLSRFRRKKPTRTVLEEIEDKIKNMEQTDMKLERRKRAIVSSMVFFIVGVYILSAVITWMMFRPSNFRQILLYGFYLLAFTVIMLFLRSGLTRYYNWRLGKNKQKLTEMRAEKKKILEDVMENETYKVAKELLAKFGHPTEKQESAATPLRPIMPRQMTPTHVRPRQGSPMKTLSMPTSPVMSRPSPMRVMPIQAHPMQTTPLHGDLLPRPLLAGSGGGSAFDKLVDFMIGDGPSRRYALICSKCNSHNGMALPEEFEYVSYWCAYCRHHNAAKKQKPKPPPLENSTPQRMLNSNHTALRHHRPSDGSDSDDAPESDKHPLRPGDPDDVSIASLIGFSVSDSHSDNREDEESNPEADSEPQPSAPPEERAEEATASPPPPPKDPAQKKED